MSTVYSVRASNCTHIKTNVLKIYFPTPGGPYSSIDANNLTMGIERVLRGTFNAFGGDVRMLPLLTLSTNAMNPSTLSGIRSTDVATVESVLAESKAEADAINKKKIRDTDDVLPQIATRADAIDEANRRNENIQAIIGAKEGLAEALSVKVGARIINAIVKSADGSDFKSIDD